MLELINLSQIQDVLKFFVDKECFRKVFYRAPIFTNVSQFFSQASTFSRKDQNTLHLNCSVFRYNRGCKRVGFVLCSLVDSDFSEWVVHY